MRLRQCLMNDITTCQYLGHSNTPCGKPAVAGKSYCADHIFDIYQKGTARAKRKKDERRAAAVWDIQDEFNKAVEELIAEGFDI